MSSLCAWSFAQTVRDAPGTPAETLPPLEQTVNHTANLADGAAWGHELDKAYYDAGTKVDCALYDLQRSMDSGSDVPSELSARLKKLASELRKEYLLLEKERLEFWKNYTRSKPIDSTAIASGRKKTAAFAGKAQRMAGEAENGAFFSMARMI